MREILKRWITDEDGIDDTEPFLMILGMWLGVFTVQLNLSVSWPSALETFFVWAERVTTNPLAALHAPPVVWWVLFLHVAYAVVGIYLGLLVAASGIGSTYTHRQDEEQGEKNT